MARAQPYRLAWEQRLRECPDITGSGLLTLLVMATYGDLSGADIRVSQARLAEDCGLSVPTVRRAIAAGLAAGWLRSVKRGGRAWDGSTTPTEYSLNQPAEEAPQQITHERLSDPPTDHPRSVERPPQQINSAPSTDQIGPLNRSSRAHNHRDHRDQGAPPAPYPTQCRAHQDAPNEAACGACRSARIAHKAARVAHEAAEADRRAEAESAPKCAEHPYNNAAHCSSCRSEVLTGQRPAAFVGRVYTPTDEGITT